MENRTNLYVDQDEQRPRRIGHFGLRVVEPDEIGEFYRNVFDLIELEKPGGDPNHYLSDGKSRSRSCLGRSQIFSAPASSGRRYIISDSKSKAWRHFKADWDTYSMTDWTKIPSAK
jgi:hypothetical protein